MTHPDITLSPLSAVICARMRRKGMMMAKPKTELGQRCPPPPYTRWDQRKTPVLLSYLKLIDRKRLCLSLETEDPDTAKRHMRLLVAWSLAKGRLSPDGGAAKLYGPKGTGRAWLKKIDAEVRRLKALPEAEYGSEALATAKRWGRPVGIISSPGSTRAGNGRGHLSNAPHACPQARSADADGDYVGAPSPRGQIFRLER